MFPFTTRLWSDPDLQPALSSSLEEPEAESSTLFEGFNLIKDSITNGDNVTYDPTQAAVGDDVSALFPELDFSVPYAEVTAETPPSIPQPRARTESDESWNTDDDLDNVFEILQAEIKQLPYANQFLLTEPLKRRQRRVVHSLARLRYLSHLSVGKCGDKRMLISPHPIAHENDGRGPWRCWNIVEASDYVCTLIPTTIRLEFRATWLNEAKVKFGNFLALHGLPEPYVLSSSSNQKVITEFVAAFETPEQAADVIRAFGQHMADVAVRYHCETRAQMMTTRPYTGPSTIISGRLDQCPHSTAMNTGWPVASSTVYCRQPGHSRAGCCALACYGPSRLFVPPAAPPSVTHNPYTSNSPRYNDYSSGESGTSGSDASSSKKRKRLPRVDGGYPCSDPYCTRIFNTAGERSKHERCHQPTTESHPYQCATCRKRFLHPKDLRRHRTRIRGCSPPRVPPVASFASAAFD